MAYIPACTLFIKISAYNIYTHTVVHFTTVCYCAFNIANLDDMKSSTVLAMII